MKFQGIACTLATVALLKAVRVTAAPRGPDRWAEVYPECGGWRQSPVDLDDIILTALPDFTWHGYDEVPAIMELTNNGHTVMLTGGAPHPRIIKTDGRIFQLDQVHFHWGRNDNEGSEHTVEGRRFALEMHAVHKLVDEDGIEVEPASIIVLTTLFEHTSEDDSGDPGLEKFIHYFESVKEAKTSTSVEPFAWSELVHHFTDDFYWYEGSLTTPPCAESVTFFVPSTVRQVTSEQLSLFRILLDKRNEPMAGNFRPIQEKHGRKVHFKV